MDPQDVVDQLIQVNGCKVKIFCYFCSILQNIRDAAKIVQFCLLDNHHSHISLAGIDYCRDNGIVLLSFPPRCSHKLQPLDRSVFGPLKKYVNKECDGWMKSHPGKTMSIYDLPAIIKEALPQAATPRNIQKGFEVSGIYPFKRNIFADEVSPRLCYRLSHGIHRDWH